MIGALNCGILLRGSRLCNYWKVASNVKFDMPSNSTTAMMNRPLAREMCKVLPQRTSKSLKTQGTDGIPLNYDIIYTSHEYHTQAQYMFTFMPVGATMGCIYELLYQFDFTFSDPMGAALNIWIVIAFYLMNIKSAILAYKAPVRIYHDKETGIYKAVFNAWRPFKIRTLEFKKGSVMQLLPPDEFTLFAHSRYRINEENIYMVFEFFRYPSDLYNMFDAVAYETDEGVKNNK
ncbi:uncharacterized protein LOC124405399 isoform X2 [Diprion similis]|nr:uncharacterized protein LOC124405399 isoform X2 [Diprion similis]